MKLNPNSYSSQASLRPRCGLEWCGQTVHLAGRTQTGGGSAQERQPRHGRVAYAPSAQQAAWHAVAEAQVKSRYPPPATFVRGRIAGGGVHRSVALSEATVPKPWPVPVRPHSNKSAAAGHRMSCSGTVKEFPLQECPHLCPHMLPKLHHTVYWTPRSRKAAVLTR
jgi:hypothetical protein